MRRRRASSNAAPEPQRSRAGQQSIPERKGGRAQKSAGPTEEAPECSKTSSETVNQANSHKQLINSVLGASIHASNNFFRQRKRGQEQVQASAGTRAEAKAETTGRARNRATAESRVLATPSAGAAEHESGEEPNAAVETAKRRRVPWRPSAIVSKIQSSLSWYM